MSRWFESRFFCLFSASSPRSEPKKCTPAAKANSLYALPYGGRISDTAALSAIYITVSGRSCGDRIAQRLFSRPVTDHPFACGPAVSLA